MCLNDSVRVEVIRLHSTFMLLITGTHRTISPESPCTHVIDVFSAHACNTCMNKLYTCVLGVLKVKW